MNFSIRNVVSATTAIALFVTFMLLDSNSFAIAFAIVGAVLLFAPFAIVFTTIIFADQRGSYLDMASNRFYQILKSLWLYCALAFLLVMINAAFGLV